jgi:diguanylate cyclase (GGDEF)-like protein
MPVQVQTLSLISAVQALALALMLWIGTHDGARQALAGMRLRAAALAVEALAYGLLTAQAWIPPAALLLGGNALNLLAQAMAVLALRMMLGEPLRRRLVGAIAVAGWLGVAWFGMVHPDYKLRVLWGTLAIVCNMALNIQVLFGGCHRGGSRARCVLMWFCVLSIALLAWRNGALWLGSNPPTEIGTPVATNVFYVLLAGMQPLFASISFLLLYNEILQKELHVQARIDPLTGVANRLALGEAAASLLVESGAWHGSLGVLIIDVDHFKSVNDRFGHDGGDTVLRELVSGIQHMLRAGDVMGRFGGEEFVVLSPGGGLAGTLVLAERIRSRVATAPLTIDGNEVQLTVSIGATAAMAGERDMAAILQRADKALYAAKRAGRNRVMSA